MHTYRKLQRRPYYIFMFGTPFYGWAVFGFVIALAIAVDLAVFRHLTRKGSLKSSLIESAAWIWLALLFNVWMYFWRGPQAGLEFLTGYLVEKSLSVDNILIFLLIFRAFNVAARNQHKVLYYGVIGALAMRALFVFAGVELLRHFHIIIFLFGAFLLGVGLRMLVLGDRRVRPERNWFVRLARKFVPFAEDYEGNDFTVPRGGRLLATPLLLTLIAVEAMDIVFAVDSVPAVLAITRDTFIVYSSNAFAILGLRALYFALANVLPRLRYLHYGLAVILVFVGGKMLMSEHIVIPAGVALGFVISVLAATLVASLTWNRRSSRS